MILDLFTDINDVRQYAQGVSSDIRPDSLYSSYKIAVAHLQGLLTKAVYEALANLPNSEYYQQLKTIVANQMMYEYSPFMNINKTKEQRLYKYQLDELRQQYISSAWIATDRLLDILDEQEFALWLNSEVYISRNALIIKDAKEMNEYYNIGGSSFFYYKTVYLQREVIAEKIDSRISDYASASDTVKDAIKRVVVYHVIAKAVQTFEASELPLNMRTKFGNEFTKDSSDFALTRDKLYSALMDKVSSYYDILDQKISLQTETGCLDNLNNPKNKYYTSI